MRHFGSFLLALVLAPLIYLLTGVGLVKFAEANEGRTTLDLVPALMAVSALLLAGVFFAVLTMVRLSPLGPTLAGFAFLAAGFWALMDPDSFRDRMPQEILGVEGAAVLPAGGLTVLLAVPLLATVASPRRWRRYDRLESSGYGTAYDPTSMPPTAAVPGFAPTSPAAPRYPAYGGNEPTTTAFRQASLGSPGYPPTAPGSPAYPPGSPVYPPTPPGSGYPPGSPAHVPTGARSPVSQPAETTTPAYPFPSPVAPTWPHSEDVTDTAEQTRPLPANPGQLRPTPLSYPSSPREDPPTDPEATRKL